MEQRIVKLNPGETLTVEYTDKYADLRKRLEYRIVQETYLRDTWQGKGERQGVAVQDGKIRILEDVIKELDKIQPPTQP